MVRFGLAGIPDVTFGTAGTGKVMGPIMPMAGDYVDECWKAIQVVPTNLGGASIVTVGINGQQPEVCQFTLSGSWSVTTTSPGHWER